MHDEDKLIDLALDLEDAGLCSWADEVWDAARELIFRDVVSLLLRTRVEGQMALNGIA